MRCQCRLRRGRCILSCAENTASNRIGIGDDDRVKAEVRVNPGHCTREVPGCRQGSSLWPAGQIGFCNRSFLMIGLQ